MHKHNCGQNLKLLEHKVKVIKIFSVSKQCIYASLVEIHTLVKSSEKANS